MSHPRKKHIQSSKITTFFPTSGITSSSSSLSPSDHPPTLRPPPPPPSIQSSLLNVGMRVRKSVPNGYKNKSPPSSQPAAPHSSQTIYPTGKEEGKKVPSSAPAAYRARELMPFCGLHSVGGLTPDSDDEEVPALTGSGSSWSTFSSSESSARKRGLDHDEEEGYGEEVEARLDAVFDEEERRIAPLRARRKDVPGRVRVEGDFDDADVGFLTPMEVDEV